MSSSSLDISNTAGKVYAKALLEIGEDLGNLDEILDELRMVDSLVREKKNFRFIFQSPQVDRDTKTKMLRDVFGDGLSRITMNFLKVLIRKQRELLLNNVLEQFIYLRDISEHRVRVDVVSAVELPDEVREKLTHKLEIVTGKTVIAKYDLDPSLLGGIKLRVGDLYLDGSVAGRIKRLKKSIETATG